MIASKIGHYGMFDSQVHVYLPEASHPANNLVRAIVKDANDNYTSSSDGVFLDSGKSLILRTSRKVCRIYCSSTGILGALQPTHNPIKHGMRFACFGVHTCGCIGVRRQMSLVKQLQFACRWGGWIQSPSQHPQVGLEGW